MQLVCHSCIPGRNLEFSATGPACNAVCCACRLRQTAGNTGKTGMFVSIQDGKSRFKTTFLLCGRNSSRQSSAKISGAVCGLKIFQPDRIDLNAHDIDLITLQSVSIMSQTQRSPVT